MSKAFFFTLMGFFSILVQHCAKDNKVSTNSLLSYSQLSKYAFQTLNLNNGLSINYRIQGNPTGENILMVHGGGDSQGVWDVWVDSLKSDYRIITFDLPGHGLTDPLPNKDYSIEKFTEYITLVVDHLGLTNFVIVGHSFGGEAVVHYVLSNPNKATEMVLISPGGFAQDYELQASNQIVNLTDEQVQKYYFPDFKGTREAYRNAFKDYYYDLNSFSDESLMRLYNLSRYDKNQGAVTQFMINHLRNHTDLNNLNSITIPTLLLWGDKDKIVAIKTAAKFQAEISQLRLIIYDDVGHMIQEEITEQSISDVLEFLN